MELGGSFNLQKVFWDAEAMGIACQSGALLALGGPNLSISKHHMLILVKVNPKLKFESLNIFLNSGGT